MRLSARRVDVAVVSVNVIVAVFAIASYRWGTRSEYGERGVVTLLSALQILAMAWLAYRIWRARSSSAEVVWWKHSSALWVLVALGGLFLVADEVLQIHERTDRLIHRLFDIRETGVTDRIDDFIIGGYGLIGLGFLIAYRKELQRARVALPYFVWGFILVFLSVAFDAASNGDDLLLVFFDANGALRVGSFLFQAEELLKIFAEGLFILGFYRVLQAANRPSEVDVPQSTTSVT